MHIKQTQRLQRLSTYLVGLNSDCVKCCLLRSQSEPASCRISSAANYVPRRPQIVVASSAVVLSVAIEIQGPRVALRIIFKASKKLFQRENFKSSVIPQSLICRGRIREVLLYFILAILHLLGLATEQY